MEERYPPNSNVSKQKAAEGKPDIGKSELGKLPEKQIKKVVQGEVVRVPPSMGKKLREIFSLPNMKRLGKHLSDEMLIPTIKNLLFDAGQETLRQTIFGESASYYDRQRRQRTDYQRRSSVVNPKMLREEHLDRGILERRTPVGNPAQRRMASYILEDGPIASKEEAESVLDTMFEVMDTYGVVACADYYEMLGLSSTHTDFKYGWTFLTPGNTRIIQTRDGWHINLPKPEPI